ncbi:uncharacterized protein DS421_13g407340 [Arachis hypogaea]|nr:uncharacterized protein DS421_13g407340 [Arachis hypogaea]
MLPLYFTRRRRARRRGAVSASLPFEGLCLAAVVPPCFTVTELCHSLLFGLVMLLRKLLQEEEQAESPCFGPPGVVMWLPGSPPELRAELLPLETLLPLCSTAVAVTGTFTRDCHLGSLMEPLLVLLWLLRKWLGAEVLVIDFGLRRKGLCETFGL